MKQAENKSYACCVLHGFRRTARRYIAELELF
jgi:hypothetical protein